MITRDTPLFNFKLVASNGFIFESEVRYVYTKSKTDSRGILAEHAPMFYSLEQSEVTVVDAELKNHKYRLDLGILQVKHEGVFIACSSAESVESDLPVD